MAYANKAERYLVKYDVNVRHVTLRVVNKKFSINRKKVLFLKKNTHLIQNFFAQQKHITK